ncbi:DEAD/DEAH box helicase [Ktedonospora formicarum]|uniref:DEAD/DEAH box helicase n=1 Tax=Ktedonospora formicarum TaxID=2778364 RepID=UPI001C68BCAA|nr:DEAD/DEAH box helicase [Ktedonospora formicarum]
MRIEGIEDDICHSIVTDIYAKDDIYFSLNRHYEPIQSAFPDFRQAQGLHPRLDQCFATSLRLYKHQALAIQSIRAGQTTIIATGTGSGKTESFLIPILDHCLRQRTTMSKGIKALILYPLNALANDQIRRILDAVKGTGIRVGCFVGSTPATPDDKLRTGKDRPEHVISRKEMIDNPPDILITNFVMLDRLITKSNTRSMFTKSSATLRYVVVDELHYFRGTKGTNLSLLLRRLRTFCQQPLLYIGASGTLKRSGGYYPDSTDKNIKTFIKQVFGKEPDLEDQQFQVIEPVFLPLKDATLEPLPATDDIDGNSFFNRLDATWAQQISNQLFGPIYQPTSVGSYIPGYEAASHSLFIHKIKEKLSQGACTIDDFVAQFTELYQDTHHKAPRNPRKVVEAYWSLINYLNQRCSENAQSPFLDYRLHIILNNIGEELTRCLLCGKYHDGRCSYCRFCNNGLLFQVSRTNPRLCIAYLSGNLLFPQRQHTHTQNALPVLAEFIDPSISSTQAQVTLQADIQPLDDIKNYHISTAQLGECGVNIQYAHEISDQQPLLLSDRYTYWHNVLKIADALVLDPQVHIAEKLLSFIDNKEHASNIKVRLSDEIADRVLSQKAALIWQQNGPTLNLQHAFNYIAERGEVLLQNDDKDDIDDNKSFFANLELEFPFWFSRMLSYTDTQDVYRYWRLSATPDTILNENEQTFLDMLLQVGAIDRTSFWTETETDTNIQHFHLDKARLTTEYGVGLQSVREQGHAIYSLGEQGKRFQEIVERFGSQQVESVLESLMQREIIVRKETPAGIPFYQLSPESVNLEVFEDLAIELPQTYPIIACHTADHSDQERTLIEKDFNDDKIKALICTPTLEMGVDIGRLSSVLMIGFPPSPANYTQRAGRAGRGNGKGTQNRLATIVTLASQDAHNQYYYADPRKMIDGEVTPPQLSLTNYSLLTAHTLAYLAAVATTPQIFTQSIELAQRVQDFCRKDPLQLRLELDKDEYKEFTHHLQATSSMLAQRLVGRRIDWEFCYRQRIFPDYGFRQDGTPLLDHRALNQNNDRNTYTDNEEEDWVLTAREPETAPRKLVPGRTLFCSGRVAKIASQQPGLSYRIVTDPYNQSFRMFRYLITDPTTNIHVERWRDSDTLYRVSHLLQLSDDLEEIPHLGPSYCRSYYIRKGLVYFINEGEVKDSITPFSDNKGTYRLGTKLTREGLLIRFADNILPTSFKANLLAVLLRCIPDYCNLDDSEVRILQHINIHTPSHQTKYASSPIKESYAFLYGQDESKLVPFLHIFQAFQEMLNIARATLQNCSCKGKGCYLCLFSLNSSSLMGHLSHQHAMETLETFLQYTLLKPHILVPQTSFFTPDVLLTLSLRAGVCYIRAENPQTRQKEEYQERIGEDQNTTIYHVLLEALQSEWQKGARSVKIFSSLGYITQQLQSENIVKKGRGAFVNLKMHLLSWQNWTIDHIR